MKIRIRALFVSSILILCTTACNKSLNQTSAIPTSAATLTASVSIAKKGEPVTFTVPASLSSASLKWSVSPSIYATLVAGRNSAIASFSRSGSYLVTACDTAHGHHDSSCTTIIVNDSTWHPQDSSATDTIPVPPTQPVPPILDTIPMTGVGISISAFDSASLLLLYAQTNTIYPGNPILIYTGSVSGSGLSVGFDEIISSGPAGSGDPAKATIRLNHSGLSNGTYPFSVTLDGTVYSGSVTISATTVTFSWSYTSGVTISPMTLTRI